MTLSNYHTHTSYCDGKDSPEELVREAIRLGCPELGFSGHSHVSFDDCCMTPEGTETYKNEIRRLRELYRDQIRIRLGVEQDFFGDLPTDDYEYVIGSVHYVPKEGQWLSVDSGAADFDNTVKRFYGGDVYAFAEEYYALVGQIHAKTACTVVGHFDLITKFNEANCRFDTAHPRYRRAAGEALEALLDEPVVFEINTGAIARGYRRTPYPENWILQELIAHKAPLLLSSDCHDRRFLLHGLEQYRDLPGVLERIE